MTTTTDDQLDVLVEAAKNAPVGPGRFANLDAFEVVHEQATEATKQQLQTAQVGASPEVWRRLRKEILTAEMKHRHVALRVEKFKEMKARHVNFVEDVPAFPQ